MTNVAAGLSDVPLSSTAPETCSSTSSGVRVFDECIVDRLVRMSICSKRVVVQKSVWEAARRQLQGQVYEIAVVRLATQQTEQSRLLSFYLTSTRPPTHHPQCLAHPNQRHATLRHEARHATRDILLKRIQ